ncbi:MAG: cation transporter [Polyangiaceae bacterium]|nr:cation transporter [Myxococcales bacterium]MCB9590993.1 cation transporter [Polyangiaceae bacterium]
MHGHAHGGHSHGHGHGHGGATDSAGRKALTWALALNGAFLVIEVVVGFMTNSLALLSDAAHMVTDVGALSLALAVAFLARRAPSPTRSFGLLRAEVLGAFVNGIILAVACFSIFREAIERMLGEPVHVAPWPVMITGLIGLAINLGSAWHLYRSDSEGLNVRGALAHMLADALGSLAAVIAAGGVWLGFPLSDPIASLVIGALVLWGTWRLLKDATRVLLDFAPAGVDAEAVLRELEAVEGVTDVHELHLWSVDGREPILSAHIVYDDRVAATDLRVRVEELLTRRFQIRHTTLQTEPRPCGAPCALFEAVPAGAEVEH